MVQLAPSPAAGSKVLGIERRNAAAQQSLLHERGHLGDARNPAVPSGSLDTPFEGRSGVFGDRRLIASANASASRAL